MNSKLIPANWLGEEFADSLEPDVMQKFVEIVKTLERSS